VPVDPTIWLDFSAGDPVTAKSFRDRFIDLQKFLNGGILKADLKPATTDADAWVTTDLIFKPEFFDMPAPRVEGVSSDTHYRYRSHNKLDRYYRHEGLGSTTDKVFGTYEGDGDSDYASRKFDEQVWEPIEGMAATVYVPGDVSLSAVVLGTAYAFESGGQVTSKDVPSRTAGTWLAETANAQGYENQKYLGQVFVETMLWVDTDDGAGPQGRRQTQRRIYPRSGGSYNFRRAQVSFLDTVTLTPGVNKISYRAWYRLKGGGQTSHKHCYIDGRNFIVDLMRL